MSTLILLSGVPASGKSYFAKNHINEESAVYISRDEVRFEILKPDDEYFSQEDRVFKEFTSRIAWSLTAGFDVWADATHLNEKSRNKLFRALENRGINFEDTDVVVVSVVTDFSLCEERNSKREGLEKVPASALRNMANSFRPATLEEERINTIVTINNGLITVEGEGLSV